MTITTIITKRLDCTEEEKAAISTVLAMMDLIIERFEQDVDPLHTSLFARMVVRGLTKLFPAQPDFQ